MKRFASVQTMRRALLWVVLSAAAGLQVGGCAAVEHPIATARSGGAAAYFDGTTLDLTKLLPPPPANDSPQTRAELNEMLAIQQSRSSAQAARAAADARAAVYRLADALGDPAAFTKDRVPLTDTLFRRILASEGTVMGAAKRYYGRPRPFVLEPQLEPVIAKPPDGSYPSGHSTWVRAVALVLADMIPERRPQILARADEYAHNRVVAGVHYPSDIEAGKLAGTAIAAALYASDDFRADLAAATSELRRALQLPARPSATPAAPAALATH
jgi:acid phosphatase (class A)